MGRGRREGETRFHSIPSVESKRRKERGSELPILKWEVKRTVTWQSESHPHLLSLPHTANPLSPPPSSQLSITVHARHWRVEAIQSQGSSWLPYLAAVSSFCPMGSVPTFLLQQFVSPSPPSKEIHRIGTGPLTAVRSRSAATSFATDVGSRGAEEG